MSNKANVLTNLLKSLNNKPMQQPINNNKQQTAVEKLYLKFATCSLEEMVGNINVWFDQAKEMEKQQIIEAYDLGSLSDMQYPDPKTVIENGEQYYNETYNTKKP
jgi:hypothetical protein